MPCATIHMLLAERALRHFEDRPERAPFPVGPRTTLAFLHGSMGPDWGFVPGVDRFMSELAHYYYPADLTRALVREATTHVETAFAWGWVAHVLGDAELHPVTGHRVGELLHGDRQRRVDARDDVETHVSVEVGLDIVILERHPGAPAPPATTPFAASSMGFLERALSQAYGVHWSSRRLARDHSIAMRQTAGWPRALRLVARSTGIGRTPAAPGTRSILARSTLGLAARMSRSGTAFRGFLRPREPVPWMIAAIESFADRFPEVLDATREAGIEALPNRNLESGQVQDGSDPHPEFDRARRRLKSRRSPASVDLDIAVG